jgi:hypothetical protein
VGLQNGAGDARCNTDEGVDGDVVDTSLDVKLQIIALIAVYLSLVDDDTNLLWQPARNGPELLGLRAVDCRIQHENGRNSVHGLSSGERLVTLAPAAPSSAGGLAFDARFENLRERRLRSAGISWQRFLDGQFMIDHHSEITYRHWVYEVVDERRSRSRMLAAAVHASNSHSCRSGQDLFVLASDILYEGSSHLVERWGVWWDTAEVLGDPIK